MDSVIKSSLNFVSENSLNWIRSPLAVEIIDFDKISIQDQ